MERRAWQDDGGQARYVAELHADAVELLDGRRGEVYIILIVQSLLQPFRQFYWLSGGEVLGGRDAGRLE